MKPRKQLSMVLPQDLIEAIKERASARGVSITAYVAELVRRDLGQLGLLDSRALAEEIKRLQARVALLEQQRECL